MKVSFGKIFAGILVTALISTQQAAVASSTWRVDGSTTPGSVPFQATLAGTAETIHTTLLKRRAQPV
jgi:hypothetical protein